MFKRKLKGRPNSSNMCFVTTSHVSLKLCPSLKTNDLYELHLRRANWVRHRTQDQKKFTFIIVERSNSNTEILPQC